MIQYKKGDIFDSEASALVNPVNTDGVMGKGLAFQFKKLYPDNLNNYLDKCKRKFFDIGTPLIWTNEKNKIIINFPTKRTWREKSKIEYITTGLKQLEVLINELNIKSIAIPPIGAGNGKLDWDLVLKEIKLFDERLPKDRIIEVYVPTSNVLKLNRSHFYIIQMILSLAEKKIKKSIINDIFFQKIIFLSDNENYFKFSKALKGPFSKYLSYEYNYIKDFVRIRGLTLSEVKEEILKQKVSSSILKDKKNIEKSIELFQNMQKYFSINSNSLNENEIKIELLGTIIFLLRYEIRNDFTEQDLYSKLICWNKRKEELYNFKDVVNIINFLEQENILKRNIFNRFELLIN